MMYDNIRKMVNGKLPEWKCTVCDSVMVDLRPASNDSVLLECPKCHFRTRLTTRNNVYIDLAIIFGFMIAVAGVAIGIVLR